MGADLYIRSISAAMKERYEPQFEQAWKARDKAAKSKRLVGSRRDEVVAKHQARVTKFYNLMYSGGGYFRDSYNVSCLLNRLGYSWWTDVGPMLTKRERLLTVRKARKLRELVWNAAIPKTTKRWMKENHCHPGDTVADYDRYFADSKVELVAFLDRAIALKESIYCSI